MTELRIEVCRGGAVESTHRVHVAVVDGAGRLVARSGDPALVTFWRSAAKPFQAMPLVEDGVLDRLGLGEEELALACASHSSEPVHLAVTERFLARIGCAEDDLACGPHPPLGPEVAAEVARLGTRLTPRWSNCSGKHAGMLALARRHGWATTGYQRAGHPVQQRILTSVARWTDMNPGDLVQGVDGCTTVCFGLPLDRMALAWARLAVDQGEAAAAIRHAMTAQPELIAGTGRFDTAVMAAGKGAVIAKIGAEGIYSAALMEQGLGVAMKIEDGSLKVAPVALLAILRQLIPAWRDVPPALASWTGEPVLSTRGETVGETRAAGHLRELAP